MKIFTTDSKLLAKGATPYRQGSLYYWYEYDSQTKKYDTSKMSMQAIDKACATPGEEDKLLLVDLELLKHIARDDAVTQLRRAIARVKTNHPKRRIGVYWFLPQPEFWIPYQQQQYLRSWNANQYAHQTKRLMKLKSNNDYFAANLCDVVDFVAPQLYEYEWNYDNLGLSAFRVVAEFAISEAVRIANGKPIYPIVMPSLHPCRRAIPDDYWGQMLEYVAACPLVDAILIHTSSTYTVSDDWREPLIKALEPQPSANQ